MPRKPDAHCTPEDLKVMQLAEWILETDYRVRVFTTDIITAIRGEREAEAGQF